jgi:hypothetical protein
MHSVIRRDCVCMNQYVNKNMKRKLKLLVYVTAKMCFKVLSFAEVCRRFRRTYFLSHQVTLDDGRSKYI